MNFKMDVEKVLKAARGIDLAGTAIRGLSLPHSMGELANALPDTPRIKSPVKELSTTADEKVKKAIERTAGQVEAFGALVCVSADISQERDIDSARRIEAGGTLPTAPLHDPANSRRPRPARG